MKIIVDVQEVYEETEIHVACKEVTPEIEKVVSMIRMLDLQLTGKKGNEIFIINISDVLYIETVDRITFIYTSTDMYESNLKLYELEEQLEQTDFIRINKSCVINMKQILSLKADLNRRIKVTMSNQEQVIISRQYAKIVKERLGVK